MERCAVTDVLAGIRLATCVEPHVRSFARALIDRGYTSLSTREYVQAAAHLGQWMDARAVAPDVLTDAVLRRFARHRCACQDAGRPGRRPSRRYVARVRRFAQHLRDEGQAPRPPASVPALPAPLVGFREWLHRHRGLAVWTIRRYESLVVKMLPTLGGDPRVYDAGSIRRALLTFTRDMSRAYAKCHVSALRAFVRFLAVEGRCRPSLDHAVPTIPTWRLSALPQYLPAADVERVIASCDRETPCGIRDRAVLLLLARLGLRASDIVTMTLDDLDWTAATLRVHAKSRRAVRLPLPQDVGDAILAYLADARPATTSARVFLCARAPVRAFSSCVVVSDIVRLALKRAGIVNPPSLGAHLLRHSAATAMLRAGAGLDVIATVLRHASTDTTAHYAKVDVELLARVAQPWPEVSNAHH